MKDYFEGCLEQPDNPRAAALKKVFQHLLETYDSDRSHEEKMTAFDILEGELKEVLK